MGGAVVTFADRIASASSKALRLTVSIDGVPLNFTAAMLTTAPAAPAIDGRGMLVSVDESTTTLDRQKRTQVGGGFVAVVQDRSSLLRNLFSTRSFRVTYLVANATRTATTLTVSTTAGLPSSGVAYIAGETITYTGKTVSTLTGCTRGAYGSPPQAHRGGSEQGASVFTVPPSWLGRRVRLTGTFDDDDGNPDTSTTQALGTFRLERAPVEDGQGRWELRCSHLSDEFGKRKVGTGIKEIKTPGTRAVYSVDGAGVRILTLTTVDGVAKLLTQGAYPTHLMVQSAGRGRTIFPIKSVTDGATGDTIVLYAQPLTDQGRLLVSDAWFVAETDGGTDSARDRLEIEWVKQVCLLDGGTPANLLKYALASSLGDGTNGSNDVLGGTEPTVQGGPGFRLGAGILAAEIDAASLTTASIPVGWSWVIDEELSVADIIRDYCRDSNTAAVFGPTGQLTFAPLIEQRATAAATIAEDDVMGPIRAFIVEEAIFGRARLECGYDPIDGAFEAVVDVIDEEIAATYAPAEGSLVLQSRSIMVDPIDTSGEGSLIRPTTNIDEILPDLRRSMLDNRGGSLFLRFTTDARHINRSLGDLVAIAFPSVSDFRGGDCTDVLARIVERTPDWQALTVEFTVLVEERLQYFAPFLVVTSVAAPASGTQVVAGSTTDFGHGATPAASFRVGDACAVYNPTTNVLRANNVQVTATNNVATLTVQDLSGVVLPIVVGEVLLYSYAPAPAVSFDGFAVSDYAGLDGMNNNADGLTRWR